MMTGLRDICRFIRKEGWDIAVSGGHGDGSRVFRVHRATMGMRTNEPFLILTIGFTVGFRKYYVIGKVLHSV